MVVKCYGEKAREEVKDHREFAVLNSRARKRNVTCFSLFFFSFCDKRKGRIF